MKLEAVITCVNYSDFLAETLPHNRVIFDRTVVVTAPEDRETRRICEFWNVECIPTDSFDTRWSQFRKGAGINAGLAALDKTDWLVHLDADVLLPPLARKFLENAELAPSFIYGIDRHICKSAGDWREFMALPQLQHESKAWLHLDKFPMGTRLCVENAGWGYIPIGFFQLWNAASGRLKYPEEHTDAARGDTAFAMLWPRGKRALIPEVVGYHLESEPAIKGANWAGRTTTHFGEKGKLSPPVAAATKIPKPVNPES